MCNIILYNLMSFSRRPIWRKCCVLRFPCLASALERVEPACQAVLSPKYILHKSGGEDYEATTAKVTGLVCEEA